MAHGCPSLTLVLLEVKREFVLSTVAKCLLIEDILIVGFYIVGFFSVILHYLCPTIKHQLEVAVVVN